MSNRTSSHVTCALACVLALSIGSAANAASISATSYFTGTDQTMHVEGDLAGSVSVHGVSGLPLGITMPDQTHPLVVENGPIMVDSNPESITVDASTDMVPLPQPGALMSFDSDTWFLDGVSDMHVDLLNGQSIVGALEEITLSAFILGFIPAPQATNFDFTISSLDFWQSGPTVFANPGAATSEFTMPGTIRAALTANASIGSIYNDTVIDDFVEFDLDLIGTATTSHIGDDTLVQFDVNADVEQAVDESIAISELLTSAVGTIDLLATLSLNVDLHLEDLILVSEIPVIGDISGDGQVDIGDFTLWGDAFGDTGAGLPADITMDGQVDIGDFTVWGDNFGNTSNHGPGGGGGASAVPEPSSLTLFGIGLAGMMALVVRRRRAAGTSR